MREPEKFADPAWMAPVEALEKIGGKIFGPVKEYLDDIAPG